MNTKSIMIFFGGMISGAAAGILAVRTYYKSKYKFKISDFPIALKNYQQILSLPIYSAMKKEDIDYICKEISRLATHRV